MGLTRYGQIEETLDQRSMQVMGMLELQIIDPGDHRWQAFLRQQPEANIFHHPAWQGLLKECYGFHPFVMALCESTGDVHAGVPLMEINPFVGKRHWVSLPFSDHCMPLCSNPADLRYISDLLSAIAENKTSPFIEIRWNVAGEKKQTPDYVLHILQLSADIEEMRRRVHHSHLRNVRSAQSNGVQIRHGVGVEEVSAFYDLHLQTRRRQGVPIQPQKYFDLLRELILAQGLGFISLAYHDSICLAGAVFLHWQNTLTYKYGASTEKGLSLRPNHLIFWDAIQWGCDNGFTQLDFGRSALENNGLRVFKSRWGAVEEPLHYSIIPSKPQRLSNGRLERIMHSVIQNSPLWVCRISGELLYRLVG